MHKMYKNWFIHNVVAHPLMQLLSMIGCKQAGQFIHDKTLPERESAK